MSFSRFGLILLNIFPLENEVGFSFSDLAIILLFGSFNSFENSLSKNWLDISLGSNLFSCIVIDWNPSLILKFKCENRPLAQSPFDDSSSKRGNNWLILSFFLYFYNFWNLLNMGKFLFEFINNSFIEI